MTTTVRLPLAAQEMAGGPNCGHPMPWAQPSGERCTCGRGLCPAALGCDAAFVAGIWGRICLECRVHAYCEGPDHTPSACYAVNLREAAP